MSHARQVIRDYVESQVNGFGLPVFKGKAWLEDLSDLPAINIETPTEGRSEEWEVTIPEAPGKYLEGRLLAVEVEVRAVASANILDVLDGYAAQIQSALADDPSWAGNVKSTWLVEVGTEINAGMQMPVGILTMGYAATYRVDMRAPANPES